MLGRFLELALASADTGEVWQQYQKLGFVPAETGDIWSHAYGVVACQGLAIGVTSLRLGGGYRCPSPEPGVEASA